MPTVIPAPAQPGVPGTWGPTQPPATELADPGLPGGLPPVLRFETGLPGFPGAHAFAYEPLGPGLEPFARLRSLDLPGLSFTVVPPGPLFPAYQVVVEQDWSERLGLIQPEDAEVLVIVTLHPDSPPTANLLGPLVVHRRSGLAGQVVQLDAGYGVAEPLVGSST